MPGGSADAHSEGMTRQFSWWFCAVFLACAAETIAQGRDWYWYRVEVTIADANQYTDRESGVTILTRGCSQPAEGRIARLMVSTRNRTGWIAFDGGESCDVTGLVRHEEELDPEDTIDSGDDDDSTDNDDLAADEAVGMFA